MKVLRVLLFLATLAFGADPNLPRNLQPDVRCQPGDKNEVLALSVEGPSSIRGWFRVKSIYPESEAVDLGQFPENKVYVTAFVADCYDPAPVHCVKFWAADSYGVVYKVKEERNFPYTLFNQYRGGELPVGPDQTIRCCTYTDEDCEEGMSGCVTATFDVNACEPQVYHFDTWDPVKTLAWLSDIGYLNEHGNGVVITLPESGKFTVEAVASHCTAKVNLKLVNADDGTVVAEKLERHAPYLLYGNDGETTFYEGPTFVPGNYIISAWPDGDASKTVSYEFVLEAFQN